LGTVGAAGLASVFASAELADPNVPKKAQEQQSPQVPRRKLGKTGVKVPQLTIGTATTNLIENQIILRKTLDWGVSCWDTATNYAGGNSELGIGKYLTKNPAIRKKLFIISKPPDIRTAVPDVADIERDLQKSLRRMNTEYIDVYLGVHNMFDSGQLTEELGRWANSAKKRGLIRHFGFSTHKNMAQSLSAAARLDWIDAIMTAYNFRLMQNPEMQAAVEACHKAGIGLIAIKTQASGPIAKWAGQAAKVETEQDKKLVGHFLKRGFTQGQAKIKVALQDERFSSVCVGMENIALLRSNVAAVLDKAKLTREDMAAFKQYAEATCSDYCAGCAHICDSAVPDALRPGRISDIMRYLMYYNNYGEQDRARELFAQIPNKARSRLLSLDYKLAETRCPQRVPIGELIAEAVAKLA
jgi:aryl-alcohol dehydrogenase-like predicted oxidoreductase